MSAPTIDIPASGLDPADAAASQDLEQAIDAEIDALPEPYRLAFVLCEVEQRTAADAAKSLGCAVGTIESRLTRARQWLRARLTRRGITAGSLGAVFAVESIPSTARAGAIALGIGSSPVPTALTAIADRAARAGIGLMTTGVGIVGTIGVIGLGGLIWAIVQTTTPSAPVAPQPARLAATMPDLPIPESEQFRRNRNNFPLPPEAIARVGNSFLRHGAVPQRMVFSGDGKFLAAAGAGDRWLRVWDLENQRPRSHHWLAEGEVPVGLGLSQDGNILRAVIRTDNGRVAHLREYDTFRAIETRRRLVERLAFDSAYFSPDGRTLLLASAGQIRAIDAVTSAKKWQVDLKSSSHWLELSFTADGNRLAAVASGSGKVWLLDPTTGRSLNEIRDAESCLSMSSLSGDGRRLAAWCARRQQVCVWNIEKREMIKSISPGVPVSGLTLAPAGDKVVTFSASRPTMAWSVDTNVRPRLFDGVAGGLSGRYSPDGTKIAAASTMATIHLLDTRTMAPVPGTPTDVMPIRPVEFGSGGDRLLVSAFQSWLEYPISGDYPPRGYVPGAGANDTWIKPANDRSAVSPNRQIIARCNSTKNENGEHTIDLISSRTGDLIRRISIKAFTRLPVFSPHGDIVYAMCSDRRVRAWDVETGGEVMSAPTSARGCTGRLLISPSGEHFVTAQVVFCTGSGPDTIRIHDAKSGKLVFAATGARGDPMVTFSPDGNLVAAVIPPENPKEFAQELRVWETSTGKVKISFPGLGGQPAFSPDGRTLAVTHEDGIVLLELTTGLARHSFRHHGKVETALAWRPDGQVLAAASSEAPVYLWDVAGIRTGTAQTWDSADDHHRWEALGGSDAPAAFRALRQMWANPRKAIALIKSRMTETADSRLAVRACEVLELIADDEARGLLRGWAQGPGTSSLTREARDTLRRMQRI